MNLPLKVPAMSLHGAVLLPKTIMPLRIFEDRYQEMLADALAGDRMFAIVNPISAQAETSELRKEDLHAVATLGLIRVSSQNPDGTSQLMLEGAERISIKGVDHYKSYPTIEIASVATINRPEEEFEAEIVVDILDKIDQLTEMLGPKYEETARACHAIDDLEMLCHFAMQSYCTSSDMMQSTLDATDLVRRCKIVSDYLTLQIMLMNDEE